MFTLPYGMRAGSACSPSKPPASSGPPYNAVVGAFGFASSHWDV
jgi:hypothetical protein